MNIVQMSFRSLLIRQSVEKNYQIHVDDASPSSNCGININSDTVYFSVMNHLPNNQTEKALQDMLRLLEINREMVAITNRDELLNKIVSFSIELLNVERSTLFLYDREANQLVAHIATGIENIKIAADKGFCGECIKTGKAIVIQDAYADSRFNQSVDKATGFKTRNIMSIPLKNHNDDLLGVLQVLNRKDQPFSDHDLLLGETLGAQAGVTIQKAILVQHLFEKEKMVRDMHLASQIQKGLLPKTSPDIDGFDIAGISKPADETGGDIYDFIALPDNKFAFFIADATGHGIGPALIVSQTRSIIRTAMRSCTVENIDISEILAITNSLLRHDLDGNSFVTCFLGILDANTGKMSYASAGQGPLLFYSAEQDKFVLENATGIPLGVLVDSKGPSIKTYDFKNSNDMILIATDGVFETDCQEKGFFGTEHTEHAVREKIGSSASDIIGNLMTRVETFSPGDQTDDITAIILKKI